MYLYSSLECGIYSVNRIGGLPASIVQVPFLLYIKFPDSKEHISCNGLRLDETTIMTTASCLSTTNDTSSVVLGTESGIIRKGFKEFKLDEVIIEPRFKSSNPHEHDIALLKSSELKSIKLAVACIPALPPIQKQAFSVASWVINKVIDGVPSFNIMRSEVGMISRK